MLRYCHQQVPKVYLLTAIPAVHLHIIFCYPDLIERTNVFILQLYGMHRVTLAQTHQNMIYILLYINILKSAMKIQAASLCPNAFKT